MNRKEMMQEIAAKSGCSLRHVRKVLFNRAGENKKRYPHIGFHDAFMNHDTNWIDRETLSGQPKFRTANTFEVCRFPSGYVVLFYVGNDDLLLDTFGARLTYMKSYRAKYSR